MLGNIHKIYVSRNITCISRNQQNDDPKQNFDQEFKKLKNTETDKLANSCI